MRPLTDTESFLVSLLNEELDVLIQVANQDAPYPSVDHCVVELVSVANESMTEEIVKDEEGEDQDKFKSETRSIVQFKFNIHLYGDSSVKEALKLASLKSMKSEDGSISLSFGRDLKYIPEIRNIGSYHHCLVDCSVYQYLYRNGSEYVIESVISPNNLTETLEVENVT